MEFRLTACATSARGTMSPMEACQDGLNKAVPQPIRKVKPRSIQGVIQPAQAKTARATETTNMKTCADSMILRRSKLSASAPENSEKTMIGRVLDDCTSATMP